MQRKLYTGNTCNVSCTQTMLVRHELYIDSSLTGKLLYKCEFYWLRGSLCTLTALRLRASKKGGSKKRRTRNRRRKNAKKSTKKHRRRRHRRSNRSSSANSKARGNILTCRQGTGSTPPIYSEIRRQQKFAEDFKLPSFGSSGRSVTSSEAKRFEEELARL